MPPEQVEAALLFERIAACLFDLAIAAVLGGADSTLAALPLAEAGMGGNACELARKLLMIGVYAVLCVMPAAGSAGATWGQRWMGLRGMDATGARISRRASFGRWRAFVAAALPRSNAS